MNNNATTPESMDHSYCETALLEAPSEKRPVRQDQGKRKRTVCFVPNCGHITQRSDCKFFPFPTIRFEKKAWINSIQRKDKKPHKGSVVCSCHFIDGELENGPTVFGNDETSSFYGHLEMLECPLKSPLSSCSDEAVANEMEVECKSSPSSKGKIEVEDKDCDVKQEVQLNSIPVVTGKIRTQNFAKVINSSSLKETASKHKDPLSCEGGSESNVGDSHQSHAEEDAPGAVKKPKLCGWILVSPQGIPQFVQSNQNQPLVQGQLALPKLQKILVPNQVKPVLTAGTNQGINQVDINQGIRPVGINQGIRPVGFNQRVRPVSFNQGVRPVGINQGIRPVDINQGIRPVGINQGIRPVGINQGIRPVGINQGIRPVGISQGIQPAGINQGMQPVSINQGRQPVGTNHGVRPPGIIQGMTPIGVTQGAKSTGINHGIRPVGIIQGMNTVCTNQVMNTLHSTGANPVIKAVNTALLRTVPPPALHQLINRPLIKPKSEKFVQTVPEDETPLVKKLQAELKDLQEKYDAAEKKIRHLDTRLCTTLRSEKELHDRLETDHRFTFKRISQVDSKITFFTGLPNAAIFRCLLDSFTEPFDHTSRIIVSKISKEDQLLLVLMRLKMNLTRQTIAEWFDVSAATITNLSKCWITALHNVLYESIMKNFRSHQDRRPASPLDRYFYFPPNSQISFSCIDAAAIGPVNKKRMKSMLGLAPNGVVAFVGELFQDSIEIETIVEETKLADFLEPGDIVMLDDVEMALPSGVEVFHPSYQYSPESAKIMKKVQASFEKTVQNIKVYSFLDAIPTQLLSSATVLWQVCAALTNLFRTLQPCSSELEPGEMEPGEMDTDITENTSDDFELE